MQGMRVHTLTPGGWPFLRCSLLPRPRVHRETLLPRRILLRQHYLAPRDRRDHQAVARRSINMGLQNNLGLKRPRAAKNCFMERRTRPCRNFCPPLWCRARPASTSTTLPLSASAPALSAASVPCFPMAASGLVIHHPRHPDPGTNPVQPDALLGPCACRIQGGGCGGARCSLCQNVGPGRGGAAGGSAYLHAIAASSEVDNARALENEDQVLLDHEHQAHLAGTAANLDELRARFSFRCRSRRFWWLRTHSTKT